MTRGINLGCGTVILPCERPHHHRALPEELYTNAAIQWDNADWNGQPGVNIVCDLFDYPWRHQATGEVIPDNTYDVAIASHIVEHIPHHVVENGQFIPHHPQYQDGWFAWFSELWRVLKKPGGMAHILVPYAYSNSGVADPSHTRYIIPATFGYFDTEYNGSPFVYRSKMRWHEVDFTKDLVFVPHEQAVALFRSQVKFMDRFTDFLTSGTLTMERDWDLDEDLPQEGHDAEWMQAQVWQMAQRYQNMIAEFTVRMEALPLHDD